MDTMEQSAEQASKVPPAPKGTEKQVRVAHLREMKRIGRPIVMLTAYDACFASMAADSGVDIILVGDSLGMVVHGFETTLPVTLEMMILHTQSVVRGAKRPLIVSDMPFMSYQMSPEEAVRNAGRLVQEGGAQAVKLEGNCDRAVEAIRRISEAGIPVMGHAGLLPQSVHVTSGYRMQGKDEEQADKLIKMALAQQDAGAFAIVLEYIPAPLAAEITKELKIPTIGIGAGPSCDGQVLVMHDVLGLAAYSPPFAKQYANLRAGALRAFRKYARDVRERIIF